MKKAVIITGPGFEDPEVIYPYYRLLEEGFSVDIATKDAVDVKSKHGVALKSVLWTEIKNTKELREKEYQLVVIPGGYEAPDRVRQLEEVLDFIRKMYKAGKIISSTCHGPWVLISAGIMKGKKATCYIGMKDDLINAGATYLSKAVVIDENLITSDHPRNLGPWMKSTLASVSTGK